MFRYRNLRRRMGYHSSKFKTGPSGSRCDFQHVGRYGNICKHQYLRSLIAQQSARCLAGYVFASSGFGESTTDVVFAGNAFIYENGTLLAASERFSFEEQLIVSEIDVERLRNERMLNTTFSASVRAYKDCPVKRIPVELAQTGEECMLTRPVEPHPFVPEGGKLLDERCEEIFPFR